MVSIITNNKRGEFSRFFIILIVLLFVFSIFAAAEELVEPELNEQQPEENVEESIEDPGEIKEVEESEDEGGDEPVFSVPDEPEVEEEQKEEEETEDEPVFSVPDEPEGDEGNGGSGGSGGNNEEIILESEIFAPEKITRGEDFEIKITVENIGNVEAEEVKILLYLPEEIEIISGEIVKDCGDMSSEEICDYLIMCKSTHSISLGKNEIKSIVTYKAE